MQFSIKNQLHSHGDIPIMLHQDIIPSMACAENLTPTSILPECKTLADMPVIVVVVMSVVHYRTSKVYSLVAIATHKAPTDFVIILVAIIS